MIDIDRLGFSQLYPLPKDTVGEDTHTVNIIFVHGLRGHPRKTWEFSSPSGPPKNEDARSTTTEHSKNLSSLSKIFSKLRPHSSDAGSRSTSPIRNTAETTTNNAVHWPADTLPLSIPGARIWVYGYNADLLGGLLQASNQNSVLQHGNDLKVKMSRSLKDVAPIIFVAHSLGGLVVKVALQRMQSDRTETSSGFLTRLKAVVFCGTPHRGSDTASWALIARHLATVAGISLNRRQLDDLSVDSQVLDLIQDDFIKLLDQYSTILIHSFQEGRNLAGLGTKVVGDFSSKLGWSKETTETIDADHREMVRQPGVKDISAVLKEFEEGIRNKTKRHSRDSGESVETDSFYTYLDRFKTVDYVEALEKVPESHRDTCKWLWNEDAVKLWLSDAGSDVFWLHGYPGRGKSVFARFLVENLRNHIPGASTTIYFFCSYKDDRARTNKNLVSSLIHQLVSEDLSLSEAINRKHKVIDKDVTSSEATLWEILRVVLGAVKGKTVCIVIDALDELLQTHWASFLRRISELLATSKHKLRIAITSRTEPDMEIWRRSRSIHLNLGSTKQSRSDVTAYLSDTILEYGQRNNFDNHLRNQIFSAFDERADGMFQWASLAWFFFIDGVGLWSRSVIRQKLKELDNLPPGMDALYHRIMSSVDRRVLPALLSSLSWILVARRPLTVAEVSIALAMRKRPGRFQDIEPILNMKSFFQERCPHLVKVDNRQRVTFLHQSFKEFLMQKDIMQSTGDSVLPNKFFVDWDAVNLEAGIDCLSFLGLDGYDPEKTIGKLWLSRMSDFDMETTETFCHYSAENLASHLQGQETKGTVWPFFSKVLVSGASRLRWNRHTPVTFYLIENGLPGLLHELASKGIDLNESYQNKHLILSALEYPFETISFLINLGIDINGRDTIGCTALHQLIQQGKPIEIILQWLEHEGVDVNAQNRDGQTPLHAAVSWEATSDDPHLVNWLMKVSGIDPNIQDHNGRTPLTLALYWNREHAARALLNFPSVTVHDITPERETPLINAIRQGYEDISLTILSKLNSVDDSHDIAKRTVLHWTISRFMFDAFLIALHKQKDIIDKRDNMGRTALHYAAADGMYDFVSQLAARGATMSLCNTYHQTPLHIAATNGHLTICQFFLTKMTDLEINLSDINGWTALHHAIASGRDDMALWFLKTRRFHVGRKDKHGRTAVAFAAAYSSSSVLALCVDAYPEQLTQSDSIGATHLHMAAEAGNRPNILYLLEIAMSRHLDAIGPNCENKWGKRPLDLVIDNNLRRELESLGFTHSTTHLKQQQYIREECSYYLAEKKDSFEIQWSNHPEWQIIWVPDPEAPKRRPFFKRDFEIPYELRDIPAPPPPPPPSSELAPKIPSPPIYSLAS